MKERKDGYKMNHFMGCNLELMAIKDKIIRETYEPKKEDVENLLHDAKVGMDHIRPGRCPDWNARGAIGDLEYAAILADKYSQETEVNQLSVRQESFQIVCQGIANLESYVKSFGRRSSNDVIKTGKMLHKYYERLWQDVVGEKK